MDALAITIGICWTLTGLLCIALSIPLVSGRVRRNLFYGVRFPESYQSDEAWFAINQFGATRLAFWSIPMVLAGVVSFFLPLQSNTALSLVLGLAPLSFLLIPVFQSWRFARRYQQRA